MLNQLVRDCIFFGLNWRDSLAYIEQRSGGLKISRSNLFNIKKRISKNEENEDALVDGRLAHHSCIGFAHNHINWMDEIERMQKILFQTVYQESVKPAEKKNLFAMSRIATNILENMKFSRLLNIDTPYVDRIKAEKEKLKAIQESAPAREDPVPSAATIPFDSIAGLPSEKPKDQDDDEPVV